MNKPHKHSWHKRTKYDRPGWYIVGYVCACGKTEYIDLVRGIAGGTQETKIMEG